MEMVISRYNGEISDTKHKDTLKKLLERLASYPNRPVEMLETMAPISHI